MMRSRGHRCFKSFFLQWQKLLNAILRVKAQTTWKMFLSMKWNVFCNAEDRFSRVWAFLQRKVHFRRLIAQNHFFRASKNTNSVFSALSKLWECHGNRCSKASFSVTKSCLNAILRVKLKLHENVSFIMNEMFFAMQKTDFHGLSFFAAKSHFRA